LPADKILEKSEVVDLPETTNDGEVQSGNMKEFWDIIRGIRNLSVDEGLRLFSNQQNAYINTLEITMREIEKGIGTLNKYPNDLDIAGFRIEVHGLKGSLSNIGESELALTARDLENAAIRGDADACAKGYPDFAKRLKLFGNELEKAFAALRKGQSLSIPPELPPILNRLKTAMANMDFMELYNEIDLLNEVKAKGALKDELENLNNALMITNFDFAGEIIGRLLGDM
jgi:HPt (histidine-containing phosphotransfer) domain-containing protein